MESKNAIFCITFKDVKKKVKCLVNALRYGQVGDQIHIFRKFATFMDYMENEQNKQTKKHTKN